MALWATGAEVAVPDVEAFMRVSVVRTGSHGTFDLSFVVNGTSALRSNSRLPFVVHGASRTVVVAAVPFTLLVFCSAARSWGIRVRGPRTRFPQVQPPCASFSRTSPCLRRPLYVVQPFQAVTQILSISPALHRRLPNQLDEDELPSLHAARHSPRAQQSDPIQCYSTTSLAPRQDPRLCVPATRRATPGPRAGRPASESRARAQ